jgi:regulator of protease activity HflC (stomatin/prohibitin superfamily)
MIREKPFKATSGWPMLLLVVLILASALYLFISNVAASNNGYPYSGFQLVVAIVLLPTFIIMLIGFIAVPPNTARVLLLFGKYKGTVNDSGFFWVNPFFSKKKLSLRVRNFETGSTRTAEKKSDVGTVIEKGTRSSGRPSKVNDRDGNPIDISAVVVFRVVDTAEALFEVDDYEHFVEVQSEAALRVLASRHPYDSEDHEISLRGNPAEVCVQLQHDIQERLDQAGVKVIEARISHLAYAPEIAAAMLQRQQAQAVVAARTKIVEGAVGMVQMALDHLEKDGVIDLDEERKATMVSNLLVVLCGSAHTQPVINTGSLYN